MKIFALCVFIGLLVLSCGPTEEKYYVNPCDVLIRNQTGVECEGVEMLWGGGRFGKNVMPNEVSTKLLGSKIPDAPAAFLEFTESLTKKRHKLTVDMRGIDREVVSKSGQCINVVFDLTRAKMIIGKSLIAHVDLGDAPAAPGP